MVIILDYSRNKLNSGVRRAVVGQGRSILVGSGDTRKSSSSAQGGSGREDLVTLAYKHTQIPVPRF